jgi:hypothetical protein
MWVYLSETIDCGHITWTTASLWVSGSAPAITCSQDLPWWVQTLFCFCRVGVELTLESVIFVLSEVVLFVDVFESGLLK